MFPLSLLPQDTRIAELLSGISLLVVGMALLITGKGFLHHSTVMVTMQYNAFWCILCIAFGVLQISAIAVHRGLEHLRFILAWITGSFWVWLASANFSNGANATEMVTMLLGITNLYAFIVNLLLVRQSWK